MNIKKIKREDVYFVNIHEKYPENFCKEDIETLKPGDFVKICANDREKFWVMVKSIKDDEIIGTVDNDLVLVDLTYEEEIKFSIDNVYEILEHGDY